MKYMGSKASIMKHIGPIIEGYLQNDNEYVEPFVGGANAISAINHPWRQGFDSNFYVIELLTALRDGWIPPRISSEQYKQIKDNKDKYPPYLVGWAGIGCSYSGRWFEGYAGLTTTKTGLVRDYIGEAIRSCLKQAPLLNGIQFAVSDYRDIKPTSGAVIYCDPPYSGTKKYHNCFNSEDFWKWAESMSQDYVVLVSEYNAPLGWKAVWGGQRGSSISANGVTGGRRITNEFLFKLDND